jgi:hypothetical protein
MHACVVVVVVEVAGVVAGVGVPTPLVSEH